MRPVVTGRRRPHSRQYSWNGSYGVPQLVLGLCAGALYALGGGLWPAILAHAIHNGVVLLVAQ
jgi:membrane protease YdiL (CAAX protease family)